VISSTESVLSTDNIPATVTALAARLDTYFSMAEANLGVSGVGPVTAKIVENYINNFNLIRYINPKTYFNDFQKCSAVGTTYTESAVVSSSARDFNDIAIACSRWASESPLIAISETCTAVEGGNAYVRCLGATQEVSVLYGEA
jgi:hypothetical protein